ncbi:hypothetical protein [Streptomyces sp. NPDC015125]|uniref:hypothetical protein n=1 Tax=Streptomyces sp. NPDC015125 TaxID=3364938 RepID=UPI003702AA74
MFESSPPRCSPPRLLPWTRSDGAPCYLSTDNPDSPLSQLADHAEDELIEAAETLLDETGVLPAVRGTGPRELCPTAAALHRALRDVLRIAVSRGDRLPEPCDHGETRLCEGRTCCRACRQQIYL